MGAFRFGTAVVLSFLVFGAVAQAAERSFAIYVVENDPVVMKRALANALNIERYYRVKGDAAAIEIVTTGPGVHMLRADTSPVAGLVSAVSKISPHIRFSASAETLKKMAKKEGAMPPVLEAASVVPSGPGRLLELQDKGYGSVSYSLLMSIYFERDQLAAAQSRAPAAPSAVAQPINSPVGPSAVPLAEEAR